MTLNSKSKILITGGTGSFGKSFISTFLKKFPDISRLVIYSRDELKQWELQQLYPEDKYPQLRFFLGDVRDKDRLILALEGIDTVIHAAALKQVPAAEYNPMEFIKTNVLGAENLVSSCLYNNVQTVIALSTDKAAAPINLYGATKLCSDKLFIAANNIRGSKRTRFCVVRYGNVMGSRGSVIPFFLKNAEKGVLPITHEKMTRFNITIKEGVDMVFWAINNTLGGEIFVPKIPSYKIIDLANAIGPNCKKIITGIREGEKINEEMITQSDSPYTIDIGNYYVIFPSKKSEIMNPYLQKYKSFNKVPINFTYNSGTNSNFLSVEEIRQLIKLNLKSDFEPI